MQDQRFEIMEMPNAWQGRSLTCLSVRGPLSQSNGNAMSTLRAEPAEVAAVALIRAARRARKKWVRRPTTAVALRPATFYSRKSPT